jgi:hypothetical protein
VTAHKDDIYVISENDILTGDTPIPTIPVEDRPNKLTRRAGEHRTAKMRIQSRPSRERAFRDTQSAIGNTGIGGLEVDPIAEALPRTSRSSPARVPVAAMLSLVVCGAGQLFNGQRKLGALLFLAEVLALASHWALFQAWASVVELGELFGIAEPQLFVTVAAADALMILVMLFSVGHAYHMAEKTAFLFDGIRIPAVSAAASALVPGTGQILNGQPGKALFFFFCLLTGIYGSVLATAFPITRNLLDLSVGQILARADVLALLAGGFVAGLLWMTSIYDAFLVARYKRELI